ncbi:MAG: cation transporter [Trueperaceae bacterium]
MTLRFAQNTTQRLYQYALLLGIFTLVYNLLEGIISISYGVSDEALVLFGFGVDSFIECLSGLGIIAMILRIQRNPEASKTNFEKTALRITGVAFYLLTAGLILTALLSIITAHKPETTIVGLIISLISIVVMLALVAAKRNVGHKLNSAPILADANCTMTCVYMSVILLGSSLVFQLTGFGYIESVGLLGLSYFSFREGREALGKASKASDVCGCSHENDYNA